jgi:hypothetical protein
MGRGDPVADWLDDRYMTARKYDLDKDDVLSTERSEILSRLMRAVGARK